MDFDTSQNSGSLAANKLELLKYLLEEEGVELDQEETIPRRANQHEWPLSFAQQRLWFMDQLEPESHFYNEPFVIRMTGRLQVAILERSLNEIVARHEVLHTSFTEVGGQPIQVVSAATRLNIPVHDLAELALDEQEIRVRELAIQEAQQPFRLDQCPLLRAVVLRLSDTNHILLLTMHHIVSDAWSMGVLIREMMELYAAFRAGRPSPLPPLPIQYADFAQWQRQWLQDENLEAQLAYWKQQLGGDLPVLDLPMARPRPLVQTFQGARRSFTLSKALADQLRLLSRQEDATLFMTLLAAFKTLLHRYTEQDNILIGTRIAGRDRVQIEGLIGFFVNALVFRSDLSGNPSFRALLGRVRSVALGAYAHQDLPFEKLVEVLQPQRHLSRPPLFQVMFVLQNVLLDDAQMSELQLTPIEIDNQTSKYDLDLSMTEERDGQLSGWLVYNTDLFDAATIDRIVGHFQTLLESIAAAPDQPIRQLDILPASERRQLLEEWNATAAPYPDAQCVHELFAEQVLRTPDSVAAIYEQERLTYRELNDQANRLAHRLQSLGIGPDHIVGVYLERSLHTLKALLAILKAGGAYVPLDPAYPASHLDFILHDTRATAVITERRLIDQLPATSAAVMCLDEPGAEDRELPTDDPITATTPDHPIYVMYTSGSTGQPKGVAVPHRQFAKRLAWMWRVYPFKPDDIACQRTTVNFSVSIWELLGALLQGIPTVIIPDSVVTDPVQIVRTLSQHNVTRIVVVPSLLRAILNTDLDLQQLLPRLTFWSTCGEPLSWPLRQQFYERLPHATLINQYGASEVNDVCSFDTRQATYATMSVPIGRPIDNTQMYVLDRYLQPVPIGVPGELYVGSVGLARGYLNSPDLTAERFIAHPFTRPEDTRPGARLYNMRDLVRYWPDGTLEYVGRRDHQVKIRGIRIDLRSIEALLSQHPAVQQAVVVNRAPAHDPSDERLIAYVVPSSELPYTISEIRTFLRDRLPAYMIPSSFVQIPSIPLTPNGKVDRSELPEPDALRPAMEEAYIAPRNDIERTIAAIWQDVLQVEQVGINDNFFDLGGHSLLVAQVRSKLQASLGTELPVITLFQYATISALAKHLTEQDQAVSFQHIEDQVATHKTLRKQRKQLRQMQRSSVDPRQDSSES